MKGAVGLATILGISTSIALLGGRNEKSSFLVFGQDQADGFRAHNSEIYLADPKTGMIIELTNDKYGDTNPIWSLDGKQIRYVSYRSGKPEIFVMNWDGSDQRPLSEVKDPPLW